MNQMTIWFVAGDGTRGDLTCPVAPVMEYLYKESDKVVRVAMTKYVEERTHTRIMTVTHWTVTE